MLHHPVQRLYGKCRKGLSLVWLHGKLHILRTIFYKGDPQSPFVLKIVILSNQEVGLCFCYSM